MAESWESVRRETVYREARTVLKAQREVIADVDAKAMYTVRIVVVIVGVVVAAVRIGGPGVFRELLFAGGLGLLLLSMALGALTYAESDLFLGPNRSHIRRLVEPRCDATAWERDLCVRMGDWIESNHADLRLNARLLLLALLALLGGVVFLIGAVAL